MLLYFSAEVLDFIPVHHHVSLSSNDTQQCVLLHIVDNLALEKSESLTISLITRQCNNYISHVKCNTTEVFITDDDSKCYVNDHACKGKELFLVLIFVVGHLEEEKYGEDEHISGLVSVQYCSSVCYILRGS